MIYCIFSMALGIAYVVLMCFYISGWYLQKEKVSSGYSHPKTFVTILIPARNEAAHIRELLESILDNNYPAQLFEIIVIDDFSDDHTAGIAREIIGNKNGRVITLSNYFSKEERINAYKKKALEIAIGEASGALIVTTDADCVVPRNWLQEIVSLYEEKNAKFIAAPVNYIQFHNQKINPLLFAFQSLDFMTMQGITAASARLHLGNMCNGANLAFDKKTFYEVKGYEGIDQIASGDDMLLMYKFQQRYPDSVFYIKSKHAIVNTEAQPTWKDFFNQRIRWSSKADKYQEKKMTAILALVYFFNLNFLILLIVSFFNSGYWKLLLLLLFIKILIEMIFLFPVATFFHKIRQLIIFPFLQPLHILYIIIAGFLGKFGRYEWKGRIVK